jgi:hypothetical protein
LRKDGLSNFSQDHWEVSDGYETSDYLHGMQVEEYPHTSSDDKSLQQKQPDPVGDKLALAMRDLSLQANGGFVGASAYLALGRAVAGIVSAIETKPLESDSQEHNTNRLLPTNTLEGQPMDNPWVPEFDAANVDPGLAGRLLYGYLSYIPSRWPLLHRSHILDLHSRRDRLDNEYESFTLTFIYAIGGRYINPVREDGESFPVEFFQSALNRLDAIIGFNDIRSVVCLLLLSIFSLKGPSGPSVW